MKITPSKNYKKPLYALGVAAALTALAVTGCGPIGYAGGMETGVQETEATAAKEKAPNKPEYGNNGGEIDWCGEEVIVYPEETKDVSIAGDIQVDPTCSLDIDGAVAIGD